MLIVYHCLLISYFSKDIHTSFKTIFNLKLIKKNPIPLTRKVGTLPMVYVTTLESISTYIQQQNTSLS